MALNQSRLTAASAGFAVDGISTFLLADTVWSALTDATEDEWRYYLSFRSQQGFNAALMSVLPVLHDRSGQTRAGLAPFDESMIRREGRWDLVPAFFERMRRRLDMAREAGIVCGLVLLWVNYVPGSWGAERTPGFEMPDDVQERYLAALASVIADGEALLIVSGDAGFANETEVGCYLQFADLVRRTWPESVITFHLSPRARLPAELDARADALIFQSGHHGETPGLAIDLARQYRAAAAGRPVMNAEPCYEGHRYAGGVGRFGQAAVRRQIWESVVSGAAAGVTYGAHGLWGWHRGSDSFSSVGFSGTPLDWREALRLPGAESAVACRRIVETEGLHRVGDPAGPAIEITDRGWGADQVVAGTSEAGVAALYLPHGGPVTLQCAATPRLRTAIDLARQDRVTAGFSQSEAGWTLDPVGSAAEVLAILDLE